MSGERLEMVIVPGFDRSRKAHSLITDYIWTVMWLSNQRKMDGIPQNPLAGRIPLLSDGIYANAQIDCRWGATSQVEQQGLER
jgi:hypothetical protein